MLYCIEYGMLVCKRLRARGPCSIIIFAVNIVGKQSTRADADLSCPCLMCKAHILYCASLISPAIYMHYILLNSIVYTIYNTQRLEQRRDTANISF